MKKHILYYLFSSLFLCYILCVLESCEKATENRDLPVSVSPVCIILVDAKTNDPIETEKIERIDFAGRDWIKAVDFLNQKPVKAANGMVTVGLKLNDGDPNPSVHPYFYTIIIKVTNCLPVVIPIRVDEKTYKTTNKIVRVMNWDNLPEAASYKKFSYTYEKGTSLNVGNAALSIPFLLLFKDIKGNPIPIAAGADVTGRVLNLDMKKPGAAHLFPTSLQTTLKNDSLGTFSVSACTYLEMNLSNAAVSKFGNIDLEYDMNNQNVNGQWGLWNFNDQGNWVQKNKTPIPGSVTTTVQVDSLSWWTVGKFTPAKKNCNTKISFKNFKEGMNLWCEIEDKETKQLVTDGFSVQIDNKGLATKTFTNLPESTMTNVYIYDNPFDANAIIAKSEGFQTCGNLEVSGESIDTTKYTTLEMNVKFQCNKGVANIVIEPDIPIYMRATGNLRWTYMGYMEKGKLISRVMKLIKGDKYDMMTPGFPILLWSAEPLVDFKFTKSLNNCP